MKNNSKEIIILVHGFYKGEADMYPLKQYLTDMGYQCLTIDYPASFGSFKECTANFARQLEKLLSQHDVDKVHFVTHSMGGLVLRDYLAHNEVNQVGRCVLIAPPNRGTYLADLFTRICPFIVNVFKPLADLKTDAHQIPSPKNVPPPEIGVIAGSRSNLFCGILLRQANDGRVEVSSTTLDDMKDFIVQPYGHKEIHHQRAIAELVAAFLTSGRFA